MMPSGAEILHVAEQGGVPCLWARVNPLNEKTRRLIRTFGTGHPMPDSPGAYIGTFMLAGEALVFHVYSF
jgi:hypothetical protein